MTRGINQRDAIMVPLKMQRRRSDNAMEVLKRRQGVKVIWRIGAPAMWRPWTGPSQTDLFLKRRALSLGPG